MKKNPLVVDLHLRLSEEFSNELKKIADENALKPSQLARIVLQRTIPQYSRNRMWG
jgi:antitoxin component of RelBE/YafQ-DinJ toxin-antitoxin module